MPQLNIDQLRSIAHLHTGRELAKMFGYSPNRMYVIIREQGLITKQSPRRVSQLDNSEINHPDFEWVYPPLEAYFGRKSVTDKDRIIKEYVKERDELLIKTRELLDNSHKSERVRDKKKDSDEYYKQLKQK